MEDDPNSDYLENTCLNGEENSFSRGSSIVICFDFSSFVIFQPSDAAKD